MFIFFCHVLRFKGVKGEIDLVIKRGKDTVFGEVKSGNWAKKSFKQFEKKYGKQLNKLLEYGKEQGGKVEYYFKKGKVSADVIKGLESKGAKVILK